MSGMGVDLDLAYMRAVGIPAHPVRDVAYTLQFREIVLRTGGFCGLEQIDTTTVGSLENAALV